MHDGNLYYCWSCDAHRRAQPGPDRVALCPRCGQKLSDDSRLKPSTPVAPAPHLVFAFLARTSQHRDFAAVI